MTAPLLEFLKQARGWKELDRWAAQRGIDGLTMRNYLAWLSLERLAECGKELMWKRL
jgi:hypothetical protein